MRKTAPYLLHTVGQKPPYPLPVDSVQRYGVVEETPHPLRLTAAKMALAALDSHNFAATRDVEAALGSLMGFYLRQFLRPLYNLFGHCLFRLRLLGG
jgi:hypothetical protein